MLSHKAILLLLLTGSLAIRSLAISNQQDMRLTSLQWNYLYGTQQSRNVLTWSDYYWPNATLIYSLDKNFSIPNYMHVLAAMADISSRTCVRFQRTYDPQLPQVVIQSKDYGCWSHIGYLGTRQILNLGIGCLSQGIIQHELLHALAMLHMHSDAKRDNYVRIQLENVAEEERHNFRKYNTQDFDLGYDYQSLMHYGPFDFSKNGKPTIIPLKKGVKIGQRRSLSVKDVLKLKNIYCSR